jgi:hypothetical protein
MENNIIKQRKSIDSLFNEDIEKTIWLLSEHGHFKFVTALLNHKLFSKELDLSDAIIYSSSEGHTEIVELLLKNQTKITQTTIGKSLEFSISGDHFETVSLLLKYNKTALSNVQEYAIESAIDYAGKNIFQLLWTYPQFKKRVKVISPKTYAVLIPDEIKAKINAF